MKHSKLSSTGAIQHRVVSVPAQGIDPRQTHKARVQAVRVEGKAVVFEWAIWRGKPKANGNGEES
jgi:hypothetical protein